MRALIYSTPFLQMATNSISCDTTLHATYTKANVVSCHGDCNGSVTAVPLACATQSFHYLWNTGQTTQTITGLCAGTYTATITDAGNSSSTTTITATVTEPTALSVNVAADTNACNYGTATATISGGTPFDCDTIFPIMLGTLTYGVNLSNGFPAPYGNYDNSGYSRLYFSGAEFQALGFPKGNIYSAALNIYQNAGTTIYSNWEVKIDSVDPPRITVFGPQTINTTLGWNTYNFNIPFDWNGVSNVYLKFCFANTSATVNANVWYNNIGGTSYQRSNTQNVCTDPTNTTWGVGKRATTQFTVCRDTSYYHILWSNGQTTTTATGLLAGNYSVTVTDSHGCTKVQNFTVPSTATITLAGSTLSTTCPTSGCTYQWYKNGTPICSNAPTCTYTGPGNYTVMITDGSGCVFSGSYVVVGIEEQDASTLFSIHPNPASETFTITFNRFISGKINIYTILGEKVYSKDFNGITENISCRHFSPGIYFVKIINGENTYAQKLMIE